MKIGLKKPRLDLSQKYISFNLKMKEGNMRKNLKEARQRAGMTFIELVF